MFSIYHDDYVIMFHHAEFPPSQAEISWNIVKYPGIMIPASIPQKIRLAQQKIPTLFLFRRGTAILRPERNAFSADGVSRVARRHFSKWRELKKDVMGCVVSTRMNKRWSFLQ